MTLKKSFLLINILLLLLPVLISLYMFSQERTRRLEYVYYMHSIKDALNRYKLDDPGSLKKYFPKTIDYIIYSDNKEIIYSSVKGTQYDDLLQILNDSKVRHNIFKIDDGFIVIYSKELNITGKPKKRPSRINFLTRPLLPAVFSILAVTFIAFLILRSLKKNILLLVDASKNISSGNLNYSINDCYIQELAPLHQSLEDLKKELLTSRDKRARFIMGISHDLKTPLALINGYVEALSDRVYSSEDERNNYLSIIKSKSEELEGIISDLINLSRLDTGEWRYSLIKEDLGKLLTVLSEKYYADANLNRINFVYNQFCSPEIVLDRKLIIRVLDNLFSNALKATSKNGNITLTLFSENNKTIIEMKDNGKGIPKEDLGMIFEPFYKGSKSRTDNGHGLGLATVKTIITNHGWGILAESPIKDGKGSAFKIIIDYQ